MTAKGRKQIPWTTEEDTIIEQNRQQMTAKELTQLLPGRTWHAVRSRIKNLGIAKETRQQVSCDYCGNAFERWTYEARRNKDNFCDNDCKHRHFAGEGNPYWRDGKSTQHGYRMVLSPISDKTKYKREHRVVMEHHLGRKLLDWEIVHHVNGDKADNRVENLRVMNRSDHMKLHWAQGDYNNRKGRSNDELSAEIEETNRTESGNKVV